MTEDQFADLSYKEQVRIFKKLAVKAVDEYPIKLKKIKFINHGENTTFKVTDTRNRHYLLRICRKGYHTDEALAEELKWLKKLSQKKFQVPAPLFSNRKRFFENIKITERPDGRNVVLFRWTAGKFLKNSISKKQMNQLGRLMAKLHENSSEKVVHRRYWDAEGLVGKKPKFGGVGNITGASRKEQRLITECRKRVFKMLKKFEIKHPDRMGLIHADLHTGNFLFNEKGVLAIDFDDSGYGFFGYDVAIPLMSLDRFKKLSKKKKLVLKEAFLSGYRVTRRWDEIDEKMLPYFVLARRLLMLGWLNSRSDNPKLRKYLKKYLRHIVKLLLSR